MNRNDFQNLAHVCLRDAEVLLNNNQYSGAYYLSGYVIECALKACIAKNTQAFDFPDKNTVIESYTHNLEKLIKVARLNEELKSRSNTPDFESYWSVIKIWSEQSRYVNHTEQEARDFYLAITDPNHAVLQWLQQHW